MDIIWSEDIVSKLNKWQIMGKFHPYTCDNGHTLIATESGWVCEKCPEYHQDWYLDFMLEED